MSPHHQPKHAPRSALRVPLLLAVGAAIVLAQPAMAAGDDAVITVDFADDDMGFNVTSTKDISNIYVELCDGTLHKHDDLDGHYFNHTEDQKIVSVYVKSGNNGIEGNDPPGAGERFFNEGVNCNGSSTTTTTSQTSTTTSGSETTTTTSQTTTTTSETTTTTSQTETETEQIPFFGGAGPSMVALGTLGALGGAFLMLRRRL